MRKVESEHVKERQCCLCRTNVEMVTIARLTAALATVESLILGIDDTHAEGCLEIPMA